MRMLKAFFILEQHHAVESSNVEVQEDDSAESSAGYVAG